MSRPEGGVLTLDPGRGGFPLPEAPGKPCRTAGDLVKTDDQPRDRNGTRLLNRLPHARGRISVDPRGERIESFDIDGLDGLHSNTVDTTEQGKAAGFKRPMRLKAPVTTAGAGSRIHRARRAPTLAEMGLHRQAGRIPPPVIPAQWVQQEDRR